MKEIKISFLSSFTCSGLPEIIKFKCYDQEIWADTYSAPYNQYTQEILNQQSNLYSFDPGIIFNDIKRHEKCNLI